MGNLHAGTYGEGKHAELLNETPVAHPPVSNAAVAETIDRQPFAIFATGFSLLVDFIYRITEGNDYRIFESGNQKISE